MIDMNSIYVKSLVTYNRKVYDLPDCRAESYITQNRENTKLYQEKGFIILQPLKGVMVYDGKKEQAFNLGESIEKYKFLPHDYDPKIRSSDGETFGFESYTLFNYPISLWVDDESGKAVIQTVYCDETCLWQEKELIGMLYDDFLNTYKLTPDVTDSQWSSGPTKNDRNYNIYGFNSIGVNLWVWRKRIRKVLVSMPILDTE
jgi:hypothetical protein